MKKQLSPLLCFIVALGFSQTNNNVGINTNSPQQKLHIAGSDATMRIEAMNYTNNPINRNNENAPLYATAEGVLSLELKLFQNNNDGNIHTDIDIYTIHQQPAIYGKNREKEFFVHPISVTKPSFIEIKYTISFEVYLNDKEDKITDQYARAIRTYILLNDDPSRKYGITSTTYTNSDVEGTVGTYYNNATTYITLPAADDYVLHFYGSVGSGATDVDTFVKFGTSQDLYLWREF